MQRLYSSYFHAWWYTNGAWTIPVEANFSDLHRGYDIVEIYIV